MTFSRLSGKYPIPCAVIYLRQELEVQTQTRFVCLTGDFPESLVEKEFGGVKDRAGTRSRLANYPGCTTVIVHGRFRPLQR